MNLNQDHRYLNAFRKKCDVIAIIRNAVPRSINRRMMQSCAQTVLMTTYCRKTNQ